MFTPPSRVLVTSAWGQDRPIFAPARSRSQGPLSDQVADAPNPRGQCRGWVDGGQSWGGGSDREATCSIIIVGELLSARQRLRVGLLLRRSFGCRNNVHRRPSWRTSPSTSSPAGTVPVSTQATRSSKAASRIAPSMAQSPGERTARWTSRRRSEADDAGGSVFGLTMREEASSVTAVFLFRVAHGTL